MTDGGREPSLLKKLILETRSVESGKKGVQGRRTAGRRTREERREGKKGKESEGEEEEGGAELYSRDS